MNKLKQTFKKIKQWFLQVVIDRFLLPHKKWKLQNRYYELDMDMQYTDMTYEEYCKEIESLNKEMDVLNGL